ncbi:MAG: type II toxin-antitoxin system HicB family antitoxin, partial [Thermosynechococcaceae cyanobacterium]
LLAQGMRMSRKNLDEWIDSFMMRNLKMHQLSIVIEKDEFGYYAYCPALEGCQTQGDSIEEAQANIKEAISLYLSTLSEAEKQEVFGRELTTVVMEVQVA